MSYLLRCFAFLKCFFSSCAEEAFDIILMTHPSSVGALPRVCHPVPPDFDPRQDAGRVSNEGNNFLQLFCNFFATVFATVFAKNSAASVISVLLMKCCSAFILLSFPLISLSILTIKTAHFRKNSLV
jgi:hypothetical protein